MTDIRPSSGKNYIEELKQTQLAIELIELGARIQLVHSETGLSRPRLLALQRQLTGVVPVKGMLPYSTDWFMRWSHNAHSSLFANIHGLLGQHSTTEGGWRLAKSYRLYLKQIQYIRAEPILSITRAWYLMRFLDVGLLHISTCTECGGKFVEHSGELHNKYVCCFCAPSPRSGRPRVFKLQEAT